jgi:hypothetical protein
VDPATAINVPAYVDIPNSPFIKAGFSPTRYYNKTPSTIAGEHPNAPQYPLALLLQPLQPHWQRVGPRKQQGNVPHGTGRMIDQRLCILCGARLRQDVHALSTAAIAFKIVRAYCTSQPMT